MNRLFYTFLALVVVVAGVPMAALADDVAAERARLANQRIQVEEERRAREEEERLERAQAQADAEERREPATRTIKDDVSSVPVDKIEMSRALEQLRELGALRDAGYVTEAEFEQLKKKILDGAL